MSIQAVTLRLRTTFHALIHWLTQAGTFWRRRFFARGALALVFLTLLTGPASPLVTWSGVVQAAGNPTHGGPWVPDSGKPNRQTPQVQGITSAQSPSPSVPVTAGHQPLTIIGRNGGISMQPILLALDPHATAHVVGSDGLLEVTVSAGAVTAEDLSAAHGGRLFLRIIQTAPGSGSSAGGSGHISLGSYLIQVTDGNGYLAAQGLRQSVQLVYHLPRRASALDLSQVYLTINGAVPAGTAVAIAPAATPTTTVTPTVTVTTSPATPTAATSPTPTGTATSIPGTPVASPSTTIPTPSAAPTPVPTTSASTPMLVTKMTRGEKIAGQGSLMRAHATLDAHAHTLTATASAATASTSVTWDTYAPVAVFGSPDPFNTDLNAGALTSSLPLEAPAGPGGLTPPINLTYSSESVAEQHNLQGANGWVGQGWNLDFGSITWAEHNTFSGCSGCTGGWADTWQLSDPYGTAAELIPPNINVSTYWDDSPNSITPSPVQWHTAPETRAKIYSFSSGIKLPDGGSAIPPCFRVFLPNGIMEEFGCTTDSLEYYYTPGMGDYVDAWNLDLITDRRGNQIQITYQQDSEQKSFSNGAHTYIRDAVPLSVQWDSPTCLNAQTRCTSSGSASSSTLWQPRLAMNFTAAHQLPAANLTGSPSSCNTVASLRCDDPLDLSNDGYNDLPAPQVMSDFALESATLQANPSGTGAWQSVMTYQFQYTQTGPGSIGDPATGKTESVAGYLLLSKVTAVGADGQTSAPPLSFSYSYHVDYYEDSTLAPNTPCNWAPAWDVSGGNGCALYSYTYDPDSFYLATFDNGKGYHETFSWDDARNNTHGVNGGGSANANPLFCSHLDSTGQALYPCDLADDQNWSHTVLTSRTGSVVEPGSGVSQVNGTTVYSYLLSYPLAKVECADCSAGMYWGNVNDDDPMDYYNSKFMGFAQTTVTQPDGAQDVHKFYATEGYGVYDTSQVSCQSALPPYATCYSDPWSDLGNAAHGHEYEVDHYDTDKTTLLNKATTQYQVSCPAPGVSGSPNVSGWGNWNGNLVSELDHANPVESCDIRVGQADTYTYEGASSGPHVSTATSYTFDSAGHLEWTIATTTVNGGTSGSPTSSTKVDNFLWNDGVTATSSGATGTYLLGLDYWSATQDPSGYAKRCLGVAYDGGVSSLGQQNNLTYGEPTNSTAYTSACGSPANNWVDSGPLTTTATYDTYGNKIGVTDGDANASVVGHRGCSAGGASQTTCFQLDGTFDALPLSMTNSLGQTQTASYDTAHASGGWGLWPTAATDVNGQTTTSTYDGLGRVTSVTLPAESSGATKNYSYTNWCAATGAQAPCVEIDQTQRLAGTTTVTNRSFYDGLGQLAETRTPAPGGQDVVVYHIYDAEGRDVKDSVPYYVSAYTGAPGSAAFASPDTTQAATTTKFVTRRETDVTDPLSHVSRTFLSTESGWFNDTGYYLVNMTYDALGHRSFTLTDGLGRIGHSVTDTGTSSANYSDYAHTAYGYDYSGNAVSVVRPDGKTIINAFDLASRQTGMTDPDRGTESYTYDGNGNLTQTVDARGASGTIYAGYDGLNRQIWRNTTNSPTNAYVAYQYDQSDANNAGYGRLTSELFTNANAGGSQPLSGSYTYQYDARGQVSATSVTTGGVRVCPSGWTCGDVGSPTLVGDQTSLGGDSWLVRGSGVDVWGTSDQFHYVYQSQTGDGSVSAQVSSQQRTAKWAKAGVMFRASTDPGAPFYAVFLTPDGGVSVQYRATQGGSAAQAANVALKGPLYLQVTRAGTTYSAATSTDGHTWTAMSGSSVSVSGLSGSVLAGVMVSSINGTGNGTAMGSAQFAHIVTASGGGALAPSGVTSYTTNATYNDAGQLLTQNYPNGDVLTHSYDSASGWGNQLSLQQSGQTSALSLLGGETYTGAAGAMGLLTSATLGGFSSGGGSFSASYDALGRLTSGAYTYTPTGGAASTLYQVQPSYDALSNVIGVTTTLPQGVDTQVFCYDDFSRLTWAGSSGTPGCSGAPTPSDTGSLAGTGAVYSASYVYDSMNRLMSSPLGNYSYGDSAHADAATAVGSAWTTSYDAAGNMTCRAATSATTCAGTTPTGARLGYDSEGRLASWQNAPSSPTSTANDLYDGEGNRVQQVATSSGVTTTTSYIGSLEEVATSGSTTTTTAYYGGLALSVNGALSYTLSDRLGSVSESVSASTGAVSATQLYGPYGAVRYQSGTLPTSKGYTGQRSDASTSGLDYYNARYYDPVAGQFTSADTTLAGGLNRYAYVGGNPETWTDPSGHHSQACDTALCEGGTSGGAGEDPVVVQEVHPNTADTHPPQTANNNPDNPFYGMQGEFANTTIDANNGIELEGSNHLEQVQNHEMQDQPPTHEPTNEPTVSHEGTSHTSDGNEGRLGAVKATTNDTTTAAGEGGGLGGVNVTLYRAVNESEYDSVERSGFRSYGHSPSLGGKYFAYTQDGATQFAQTPFNEGHIWTITSTEVPQSMIDHAIAAGADQAFEFHDVGGANASIWFSDGKLDELIYPSMSPIQVIDQFINGD